MRIRELRVQRFRGIRELVWEPHEGVNCLVGPGDVGKTTVLQAIALAFQSQPAAPASEYDYFDRKYAEGFEIRAVLGDLTQEFRGASRTPLLWTWRDQKLQPITELGADEPVAVVRVRGTPELEVIHELLAPAEDSSIRFSPTQRGLVGMIRLLPDAGGTREFRFTRGGTLERHLKDDSLRSALSAALTGATRTITESKDAQPLVEKLRELFVHEGLPRDVLLGLLTSTESSMLAQIGLLVGADAATAVPLSLAGRGTRQLASVALAAALSDSPHLIVADEPESGLEPYRQRGLIRKLQRLVGTHGQLFLTTHSVAVLETLAPESIHYMTEPGRILRPIDASVTRLLKRNPEALLARLPIVCEGETEVGLVSAVLGAMSMRDGLEGPETLGLSFVDGGGQPDCLEGAAQLLANGVRCGLFVDREARHAGARKLLSEDANCAFASWPERTNIEEMLAHTLPLAQLDELVIEACSVREILLGRRPSLESVYQSLRSGTSREGTGSIAELAREISDEEARRAVAVAMQKASWFKSVCGGAAVGRFLIAKGMPEPIDAVFRVFWAKIKVLLE